MKTITGHTTAQNPDLLPVPQMNEDSFKDLCTQLQNELDQLRKKEEKRKKKILKKRKKILQKIEVYLNPVPSKFTNRVTFNLLFYSTEEHKKINELRRKLEKRAYGDRTEDPETWQWAEAERTKAQDEINRKGYRVRKGPKDFFELFEFVSNEKSTKATRYSYSNSLKNHFRPFMEEKFGIKDFLPFSEMEDGTILKTYRKWLLENEGHNTAALHLRNINNVKEVAWDMRLLDQNIKIPYIRQEEVEKDVLSIAEIVRCWQTPSLNNDVKRSFAFSCIAGPAIKDLKNMTWSMLKFEKGSIFFKKAREKTGIRVNNNLNAFAFEVLGKVGNSDELVFPELPKYDSDYNKILKKLLIDAGINKKITSHNGRHTYAALILAISNDLYAVKKCLGHSNINTTVFAYGHLSSDSMDKASSLGGIEFKLDEKNAA